MPKSPLTPRQRAIRREIIKRHGLVRPSELAQIIGVSRITIWRDMKAIDKFQPIPADDFAEEVEVKRSLQWFDEMESNLMDELEANEAEVDAHAGSHSQVGFLNVRCNLLGQLRSLRTERREFLLRIGYLREAPKRLTVDTPISELSREQIDAEIATLDQRIAELEGHDHEDGSAEGEEATLPLPAQKDDHLQG